MQEANMTKTLPEIICPSHGRQGSPDGNCPKCPTEFVQIPRATLVKWEGWARERGKEVSPEQDRPSFETDALADEMKAALLSPSSSTRLGKPLPPPTTFDPKEVAMRVSRAVDQYCGISGTEVGYVAADTVLKTLPSATRFKFPLPLKIRYEGTDRWIIDGNDQPLTVEDVLREVNKYAPSPFAATDRTTRPA